MTEKKLNWQSRRDFCKHAVAFAGATGALATLLEGCSSPTSPSNVSALPTVLGVRGSTGIVVTIDASSPLASVGGAALLQTVAGAFLIAHTAQNSFVALSATCTHQVCTIIGFSNQRFVCPCHGSTFDTSGHVIGGPAPAPLRQYVTDFANGILTIAA